MKNSIRFAISVTVVLIIFSAFLTAGAFDADSSSVSKLYSDEQGLLCISHRGDTAYYPENSLDGVKSALKKGADFVSVSLDKTSDGVFYLCERESLGNVCNAPYESLSEINSDKASGYKLYDISGNLTEFSLTSLVSLLENTDSDDGIILDTASEDKDAVYEILVSQGALDRIILRVKENPSKLVKWAESKPEKVNVIGVYTGNIIFSTAAAINSISEADMPAVQYESKNYFNVAYGEFFTNRYFTADNSRAVAATYSPELCGQRTDGSDGWNELISKGYSVIETNNIDAFVAYREELSRLLKKISLLCEKASDTVSDKYSQISIDNLNKSTSECEALLSDKVCSLNEAQQAYSVLLSAMKDMKIASGEVDTRGALNITAGKLIAAVSVGAALLAGQIYVYKMRRKTKEKK